MTSIENLPSEIIWLIADMCTWDVYVYNGWHRPSYTIYHAAFARTSRHFHNMLNPTLYQRNIREDSPLDSCILWAAEHGRLDTIKVAHSFGADLDANNISAEAELAANWNYIPDKSKWLASALHIAVRHNHCDIIDYFLENGASVDTPSRGALVDYGLSYPLYDALDECVHDAATVLVRHGAHLLREGQTAIYMMAQRGRLDLVELLLDQDAGAYTAEEALLLAPGSYSDSLFCLILKRPRLNASYADAQGMTALDFAVRSGNIGFVKQLLGRPEISTSASDPEGAKALSDAKSYAVS